MAAGKKASSSSPESKPALSKKQQLHVQQAHHTPFPHWPHPTPYEAQNVCDLLASVHGLPERPKQLVDVPGGPAGCGNVPDVLDALVRTILSANTTSKNSTAAKRSMDETYGRANYRAVLEGGAAKLEDCIRCGGLAQNKSKAIVAILSRLEQRNVEEKGMKPGEGELSLDWLHDLSDDEIMQELISYDSVGIKTASCVALFCLGRDSFAVDTHVWRITQSLGWLPPNGSVYSQESPPKKIKQTSNPPSRDQTFYHLDHRLPAHLKYPLHSLLVRHGRGCVRCAANGVTTQDFVETCPIDHLVRRKKGKYAGGGGKKAAAGVAVKTEEGKLVGHATTADEEGEGEADVKKEETAKFEPLEDAPEGIAATLGSTKGQGIKLEDEPGQPHDDGGGAAGVKREEADSAAGADSESPATKRPRRSARAAARPRSAAIVDASDSSDEAVGSEDGAESDAAYGESAGAPLQRTRTRSRAVAAGTSQGGEPKQNTARGMKSSKPTTQKKGGKSANGGGGASVSRDEAEMGGRVYTMHGMEV